MTWSDAARKASAEARRRGAKGSRSSSKIRPSGSETYAQAKARAARGEHPTPSPFPSGHRNSPNADRTTWQR